MWQTSLGALELRVEHRRAAGSGGPTLHVCEAAGSRRELMRFDCFDRGAHFHLDVSGRDEISAIEAWRDPIEFCISELRRDLPGYLERSGLARSCAADPAARTAFGTAGRQRVIDKFSIDRNIAAHGELYHRLII